MNGGSLIIGTNDGSDRTRISIDGGSNEIQFHTTGGQAMFSMDTASSDPRIVFNDSAGATSTILYEDPTNLGGSRGSLVIDGGATDDYEGLSIGGKVGFIFDDDFQLGIWDDINDQWVLFAELGGPAKLYDDGNEKFTKTSTGISVTGNAVISSNIHAANLPTSDPSVVGQFWNDSGTVKVSV